MSDDGLPEQSLWRAVLFQAIDDAGHYNPEIRRDALEFILGPYFLTVMDLAGFDRDLAPQVRRKAQELPVRCATPMQLQALKRKKRRRYQSYDQLEYQGKKHSIREWSAILGVPENTLYLRNRAGTGEFLESIGHPEFCTSIRDG